MERSIEESAGSVKAAISLYGRKFEGRKPDSLPSKYGELQKARLQVGRLKETRSFAEEEKSRAELELSNSKSAANELALQIKKSNGIALRLGADKDQKYFEVVRELNDMKLELCRLKLDVASVLESKSKAEKTIEASNAKANSCIRSASEISKEIEEVNEEHVLVELARIEAERECREIETVRKDEAIRFFEEIEATKEKICALHKEVDEAKDLEMKLAVTNADLSVLQNEMELVRAMERNYPKHSLLTTTQNELQEAKEELARIKEEGFQFMASIDVIRKESMIVSSEADKLRREERRADASIQHLNTRLLKAKAKLEAATAAEERSKSIVSSLSEALQQLQIEMEVVMKEQEKIDEQGKMTKQQIESSEKRMYEAEDRLQAVILELDAVKTTEAIALRRLKDVAERTMKKRASSFAQSSTITITRNEYEYLTKSADTAKTVADKKVAAAQAWIAALKAEESHILMITDMVEKEIEELENDTDEDKTLPSDTEEAEPIDLQLALATPRKSVRLSMASTRKAKLRRLSASSGMKHNPRSPSFTIKKRKTMMPNVVKFLRKGNIGKKI